jgi:hypothetical protein
MRLYSCKIYDNETLIRDYVPARSNSDNVLGLYDLVNDVFYTNAGTGTFIAGGEYTRYTEVYVDGQTKDSTWTYRPNHERVGFFTKYTKLEYLESTGTQYIDTGLLFTATSEASVEIKFNMPTVANCCIAGSENSGTGWAFIPQINSGGVRIYHQSLSAWNKVTISANTDYVLNMRQSSTFTETLNGVAYTGSCNSKSWPTRTYALFGDNTVNYGFNQFASVKIYYCRITQDGKVSRDLIPVMRNSDGALGMYDLANDVFYTNAGTGSFIAGSEIEIPKYIYGHEIGGIKDLGIWTVSGTDGDNIKTQDIMIDHIRQYDTWIRRTTYLYNTGNECIDVTGGWMLYALGLETAYNVPQAPIITRNATNMVLSRSSTTAYACGIILPKNKIDFTGYKTINITVDFSGIASNNNCLLRAYFIKDCLGAVCNDGIRWMNLSNAVSAEMNKTVTYNISAYDGLFIPYIAIYSVGSLTIHKIWLE